MAAWLPHVLWAPRFVSLPSTPLTPDFTLIKDTSELAREDGVSVDAFSALVQALSRASSLPQVRGVFEPCETLTQGRVSSSHVDYSHRSAVFRAMRMPCGTDDLVGASLLAKTVFQSMHFWRLYRPFREQARSHRAGVFSSHVDYSHRSGFLQAMWITHTGRLCFEPCECPAAMMTLWERACSRRRCFSRCIFGACTGPFASKLAPTGPGCFRAM